LFLLETGTELETELELVFVSIRNRNRITRFQLIDLVGALGREYPPIEWGNGRLVRSYCHTIIE
jgi:hypothetical protein